MTVGRGMTRFRVRLPETRITIPTDSLRELLAPGGQERRPSPFASTRELNSARFPEGPDRILDLGVRFFANSPDSSGHAAVAARKVAGLVLYFSPDLILLRGNSRRSRRNRPARHRALNAIRLELHALHVPVKFVRESQVQHHFTKLGKSDRYQMAESLAAQYPQLAWRLPPKRKPWQSEQAIFSVFDAVALAAVHFHHEVSNEPTRNTSIS